MTDLEWCVNYLKKYNGINYDIDLSIENTFRALLNITMPYDVSDEFYKKEYGAFAAINAKKSYISADNLKFKKDKISLYLGDITLLKVDAIVNAGNEKLLGCFIPLHSCVDNAIHSAAGLEVRRDLLKIMTEQGKDEENGQIKVTKGYHLPSKYIFHTVGPKVNYQISIQDEKDLRNCYLNALKKADEMNLESIAFSSISTGLYGYPIEEASKVAIATVMDYLKNSKLKRVVFVLFKDNDYGIYDRTIKELYK